MKYWRAGIKDTTTNKVAIIYFSTTKNYSAYELTDFLTNEFGFTCVNHFLHRMNVVEYLSNAIIYPISTSRTCFNYNHSILIG